MVTACPPRLPQDRKRLWPALTREMAGETAFGTRLCQLAVVSALAFTRHREGSSTDVRQLCAIFGVAILFGVPGRPTGLTEEFDDPACRCGQGPRPRPRPPPAGRWPGFRSAPQTAVLWSMNLGQRLRYGRLAERGGLCPGGTAGTREGGGQWRAAKWCRTSSNERRSRSPPGPSGADLTAAGRSW